MANIFCVVDASGVRRWLNLDYLIEAKDESRTVEGQWASHTVQERLILEMDGLDRQERIALVGDEANLLRSHLQEQHHAVMRKSG